MTTNEVDTNTGTTATATATEGPPQLNDDHLKQTRNELIETGYYLGDPTNRVQQNVVWRRVGRSHQLFAKPNAGADDDAGTTPSSSQGAAAAAAGLERAVLYSVVYISYANCFLAPCGNWEGPSKYAKSFSDVKLSFRGACPSVDEVFDGDFETAVETARWLMEQIAAPDTRNIGFVMPPEAMSPFESFRFRHVLFDVSSHEMLQILTTSKVFLFLGG